MSQTYENLDIWKKGVNLASDIYKITKNFPKDELFGMISQLRRAVISISANIAEGSGRRTKKDFCRFIDIAIGSLNEVESLLFVSKKLNYISEKEFIELINKIKELGKLLGGFRNYLNKKSEGK